MTSTPSPATEATTDTTRAVAAVARLLSRRLLILGKAVDPHRHQGWPDRPSSVQWHTDHVGAFCHLQRVEHVCRREDHKASDEQAPPAAQADIPQSSDTGDGGNKQQVAHRIGQRHHGGHRWQPPEGGAQHGAENDREHRARTERPHRTVQPSRHRQDPHVVAHGDDQRGHHEWEEQQVHAVPNRRERHRPGRDLRPDNKDEPACVRGHRGRSEQHLQAPETDSIDRQKTDSDGQPLGQHGQPKVNEGAEPALPDRTQSDAVQGQAGDICGKNQPHRPHQPSVEGCAPIRPHPPPPVARHSRDVQSALLTSGKRHGVGRLKTSQINIRAQSGPQQGRGEFRRSSQRWAFRDQTVDVAWLLRV